MDSILIKALQNQRYIPLFLLDLQPLRRESPLREGWECVNNITSMDTYAEHREGKINILFNMQANQPKYDVSATKTMLKNERRKLDREERKHFDKVTKDFCK